MSQSGQKEADFIQIVCWRKLAENAANHLKKGRLCAVSGSIQTRKYQTQDGGNRYVTEVVADNIQFLEWPKDRPAAEGFRETGGDIPREWEEPEPSDDDIPF